MKPAPFAYHRAHSVAEAVALLAELGEEAKILAGGLSLVPMMNFRLARPTALVDVSRIDGLSYLRADAGGQAGADAAGGAGLRIGALTTHRAVETSRDPAVLQRVRRPAAVGPVDRALPDPQPGHVRRQHRARRPCVGMVPARRAAGRPDRAHRTGRAAHRRGRRFLRGVLRHRGRRGRDDHRDLVSQPAKRAVLAEFAPRQGAFAVVAAAVSVDIADSVSTNAVGATVANAVRDALGLPGGVGQLPLTPARVCALSALAQSTGGNA